MPHDKKTICYTIIDSQLSVRLYKGKKDSNGNINYNNIFLSDVESECLKNLVQDIVSDPIKARNELNNSSLAPHVGHINPIYLKVERFDNSDLSEGVIVLSWDCNTMFAEDGLLKYIMDNMKL